ncbi:MAG TPA: hypothetical protein VHM70_13350 [Polyangiaceae bacterium]|jgi:hypothetical protein|nr:hypothetical protein [Polyangiaceae bacterium]
MAESFDMSGALRFDLARGRVTVAGIASRVVLPVEALSLLCREVEEPQLSSFGHGVGNEVGRRVAERLAGGMSNVSTEQMVEHLGGELALMGLGSLSVEFWGRALVLVVVDSPLVFGDGGQPSDGGDRLLSSILEAALVRATSRQLSVVPLTRSDNTVRFVVCNQAAKTHVMEWLNEGCHYGEALARLNDAGARA